MAMGFSAPQRRSGMAAAALEALILLAFIVDLTTASSLLFSGADIAPEWTFCSQAYSGAVFGWNHAVDQASALPHDFSDYSIGNFGIEFATPVLYDLPLGKSLQFEPLLHKYLPAALQDRTNGSAANQRELELSAGFSQLSRTFSTAHSSWEVFKCDTQQYHSTFPWAGCFSCWRTHTVSVEGLQVDFPWNPLLSGAILHGADGKTAEQRKKSPTQFWTSSACFAPPREPNARVFLKSATGYTQLRMLDWGTYDSKHSCFRRTHMLPNLLTRWDPANSTSPHIVGTLYVDAATALYLDAEIIHTGSNSSELSWAVLNFEGAAHYAATAPLFPTQPWTTSPCRPQRCNTRTRLAPAVHMVYATPPTLTGEVYLLSHISCAHMPRAHFTGKPSPVHRNSTKPQKAFPGLAGLLDCWLKEQNASAVTLLALVKWNYFVQGTTPQSLSYAWSKDYMHVPTDFYYSSVDLAAPCSPVQSEGGHSQDVLLLCTLALASLTIWASRNQPWRTKSVHHGPILLLALCVVLFLLPQDSQAADRDRPRRTANSAGSKLPSRPPSRSRSAASASTPNNTGITEGELHAALGNCPPQSNTSVDPAAEDFLHWLTNRLEEFYAAGARDDTEAERNRRERLDAETNRAIDLALPLPQGGRPTTAEIATAILANDAALTLMRDARALTDDDITTATWLSCKNLAKQRQTGGDFARREERGGSPAAGTAWADRTPMQRSRHDNNLVRDLRELRFQPDVFLERAQALFLASMTTAQAQEPPAMTDNATHALTVVMWLRALCPGIPRMGAGPAVTQHRSCPYGEEDVQAGVDYDTDEDPGYLTNCVVTGWPMGTNVAQVHCRLRDLGLRFLPDYTMLSSTFAKHTAHPGSTDTMWASVFLQNTPRLWTALGSFCRTFWDPHQPLYSGDLLGFYLDDTEASLRMILPDNGNRMALFSILHASGFQEEAAKWFLVDALIRQGIPVLWAHFDDSLPRRGSTPGQPCQWHSVDGGIRVIFASASAARQVLDRQGQRPFKVDLTHLLTLLSDQDRDALNRRVPDMNVEMLRQFSLRAQFRATLPRRDVRNRVPHELWPRTVLLYPDTTQADSLRTMYSTPGAARDGIRSFALAYKVPVEQVIICDTDFNTWTPERGLALVMEGPDAEDQAQALMENLRQTQTPTWEPLAVVTKGTITSSLSYDVELAARSSRTFQTVRNRRPAGKKGKSPNTAAQTQAATRNTANSQRPSQDGAQRQNHHQVSAPPPRPVGRGGHAGQTVPRTGSSQARHTTGGPASAARSSLASVQQQSEDARAMIPASADADRHAGEGAVIRQGDESLREVVRAMVRDEIRGAMRTEIREVVREQVQTTLEETLPTSLNTGFETAMARFADTIVERLRSPGTGNSSDPGLAPSTHPSHGNGQGSQ